MKRWIAKLKISEAVRRKTALSPLWQKHVDREPELQNFERSVRELDARLRSEARNLPRAVPTGLHDDILRTIREEHDPARLTLRGTLAPFLTRNPLAAAAAALAIALLALGYGRIVTYPSPDSTAHLPPQPTAPPIELASLPTPDLLLAQLGPFPADSAPDPMTAQLEALSLDAQSAARFLLNSLP